MKAVGLILISSLPVLWGVDLNFRIKKRLRFMETFLKFVIFVREQIRFSAREVDEIFLLAEKEKAFSSPIFEIIFRYVREKGKGADCVKALINAGLKEKEADLIIGFLEGLGRNDIEGQLLHCDYHRNKVSEQIDVLNKDFRQKGRLYISLSVAAALTLFIMFI